MERGHSGVLGQFGYANNDFGSTRSLSASVGLGGVVNIGGSFESLSSKRGGSASGFSVAVELLVLKLQPRGVILSLGPIGGISTLEGSEEVVHGGGAMYVSVKTSEYTQLVPAVAVLYNATPSYIKGGYSSSTLGLGFLATRDNGVGVLLATSFTFVNSEEVRDYTTVGISLGIFFDATESKKSRDRKTFGD